MFSFMILFPLYIYLSLNNVSLLRSVCIEGASYTLNDRPRPLGLLELNAAVIHYKSHSYEYFTHH